MFTRLLLQLVLRKRYKSLLDTTTKRAVNGVLTLSKSRKKAVLYIIFGLFLLALLIFLVPWLTENATNPEDESTFKYISYIYVFGIIFCIYMTFHESLSRIVVTESEITVRKLFWESSIRFELVQQVKNGHKGNIIIRGSGYCVKFQPEIPGMMELVGLLREKLPADRVPELEQVMQKKIQYMKSWVGPDNGKLHL